MESMLYAYKKIIQKKYTLNEPISLNAFEEVFMDLGGNFELNCECNLQMLNKKFRSKLTQEPKKGEP